MRDRLGDRDGIVAHYNVEYSRGSFPVRFADGIWRRRGADELTVVEP